MADENEKRNFQLASQEEMERMQDHIEDLIESYQGATQNYRTEWERWAAAYNCVYRDGDHALKTEAKLYDPETADSIDTVTKRINVAIFSNDKISELDFDDYEENDLKNVAQALWNKLLDRKFLREKMEPILKDGAIYGTLIGKVIPNYKEKWVMVTDPQSKERTKVLVVDSKPQIKPVNIFDFVIDPTLPNEELQEAPLIAERLLIPNSEITTENGYIKEKVVEYNQMLEANVAYEYQSERDYEIDSNKREFYDISGIDVNMLITTDRRYVYHVHFKWEDADGKEDRYFAVVDAITFDILKLEENIYDGGNIPYRSSQYLPRPGCFYGIGAAEQAGALQTMLNDTYNSFLDSVTLLNNSAWWVPDMGGVEPEIIEIGKFKFVKISNPDKVVPIVPHGLPDIMAVTDKLREQIQKKTKATMLMQGLPMEGTRTATEMVGIREEQNLSIKDIIDKIVQSFVEPFLNLYKIAMVQDYEAEEIKVKVPVNDMLGIYETTVVRFDDIRELFAAATIKVVSVKEQNEKAAMIAELKQLMGLALQSPQLLSLPYIMRKLYFDLLGFKDFDKMLATSVNTQSPIDVEQEKLIMSTGQPLNTHNNDNHQEHIVAHTAYQDELLQASTLDPKLAQNPTMQDTVFKLLYNVDNHIKEHVVKLNQQLQMQQPGMAMVQ